MRRIREGLGPITANGESRFVFEMYVSTLAFGFLYRRKTVNGPSEYPALGHFLVMLNEFCNVASDRSKNNLGSDLVIYVWKVEHAQELVAALKSQIGESALLAKIDQLGQIFSRLHTANQSASASHRSKLIRVRIHHTEQDELRFFMLGDEKTKTLRIQLLLMTPVKRGKDGSSPTLDSILLSDQTVGGSKRLKEYAERFISNHCTEASLEAAEQVGSGLLQDPTTELWKLLGVDRPSSKQVDDSAK